jgi:hypothetical protein
MKVRWSVPIRVGGCVLSLAFLMNVMVTDAQANRVVVNELKKLKSSLSMNDPSRTELSLRIADRLVDESFSTQTIGSQAAKDRQEAIALYQEVLPKVSTAKQTKIRFQMARLYLEQGQPSSAQPLLIQVYNQSEQMDLKRESALRLAEISEEKNPSAAETYYAQSLAICQGTDSCSYAHYRMGWIKKNRGDLPGAVQEMKLALWDSKGQLREEALRDLTVFMGQDSAHYLENSKLMEEIAQKSNRSGLLKDLAFSYLGAGEKNAAVQILEIVISREPSIDLELKYLEELYGVGPWEKFQAALLNFSNSVSNVELKSKIVNSIEAEKIALRLSIQLDGDRTTRKERNPEFQSFALSTLELFPQSKERIRLIEGWVASESDVDSKLSRLKNWIYSPTMNWSKEDQAHLLELRIGIAQKAARPDEMIADIDALVVLAPHVASVKKKEREYSYARAYALYQKKDLVTALPAFQKLAIIQESAAPDTFAIQAQNLALDILNQQKNLDGIKSQAESWTKNQQLSKNRSIAKDLSEMQEIASQAEFEQAVVLGETDESLRRFKSFCLEKRFLPKSCDNAKTLAIKLSRHPDLIAILKVTGPADELTNEFEAGGYFAEAARGLEAVKDLTFAHQMKTALFYELGDQTADRNRILSNLVSWSEKNKIKPSELEEKALASAMEDAGVFDIRLLKSNWSSSFKARVAESLQWRGKGNAQVQSILLSQKMSTGPGWDLLVAAEVQKVASKEKSITFHGRNGEAKFQERVKWLKKLAETIETYSPGAPIELRMQMLVTLMKSHQLLAEQIVLSPIPSGLTPDQETTIREGLSQMAKPFEDRTQELTSMIIGETEKMTDEVLKSKVKSWMASSDSIAWTHSSSVSSSVKTNSNQVIEPLKKSLIEKLHINPKDVSALTGLRDLYRTAHQDRLAYYFEGRIKQISQEVSAQ